MKYDRRALKRLMAERGMDEKALIARTALAPRTVYYLVRGMTQPRAETLAQLAGALGVDVNAFFRAA